MQNTTKAGVNPVIPAGAASSLVAATIAVLVAYGVEVTKEQAAAILGLVAVLSTIVPVLVARMSTMEYLWKGKVVRGNANEGPTGEIVRDLGEPVPRRAVEDLNDAIESPPDA